ncbi:hypothetical protein HZB90_05005 [archaeon]|nr:hypothetical protein [archaeon]
MAPETAERILTGDAAWQPEEPPEEERIEIWARLPDGREIELTKRPTLDIVLAQDVTFMTDTYVGARKWNNWYSAFVYGSTNFLTINDTMLRGALEAIKRMERMLIQPHIHTAPKIAAQIQKFRGIMRQKLEFLKENERRQSGAMGMNPAFQHMSDQRKHTFEEICTAYDRICRITDDITLRPSEPEIFNRLERAAILIAESTGAKKYIRSPDKKFIWKGDDDHADENLAASAMYLSVFEGQLCHILTPDSDIGRIVNDTYHFLAQCRTPLCRIVAGTLQDNPVMVLYILDDTLQIDATTSLPPKSRDMYLSILGSNNRYKGLVRCVEAIVDPECD